MGPGALVGQQALPQEMTAGAWLSPLPMQQQAALGTESQPAGDDDDTCPEYELQLSAYPGDPLWRKEEDAGDVNTSQQGDQDTPQQQLKQKQQQQGSKRKDPVTYFGALPPQALKSAASDFSAALQQAVQAANLGQRLQRLVQEWEAVTGTAAAVQSAGLAS